MFQSPLTWAAATQPGSSLSRLNTPTRSVPSHSLLRLRTEGSCSWTFSGKPREGVTSANPLYFDAKDAEGRKGEIYMFADGQLGSGEVLPGDKSRGFVAFDMAPGIATVTVTDPLLQAAARIQVGG